MKYFCGFTFFILFVIKDFDFIRCRRDIFLDIISRTCYNVILQGTYYEEIVAYNIGWFLQLGNDHEILWQLSWKINRYGITNFPGPYFNLFTIALVQTPQNSSGIDPIITTISFDYPKDGSSLQLLFGATGGQILSEKYGKPNCSIPAGENITCSTPSCSCDETVARTCPYNPNVKQQGNCSIIDLHSTSASFAFFGQCPSIMCNVPPDIDANLRLVNSGIMSLKLDEIVLYVCKKELGYVPDQIAYKCTQNQNLVKVNPSVDCELLTCDVSSFTTNIIKLVDPTIRTVKYREVVTFKCARTKGYLGEDADYKCFDDSMFVPTMDPINCTLVTCPLSSVTNNAIVPVNPNKQTYNFNETALFKCLTDDGFVRQNIPFTCWLNGRLTPDIRIDCVVPSCVVSSVRDPRIEPVNTTSSTVQYGTIVKYGCDRLEGFIGSHSYYRCSFNGIMRLIGNSSSCVKIQCEISTVKNKTIIPAIPGLTTVDLNQVITFECDRSKSYVGPNVNFQCMENGNLELISNRIFCENEEIRKETLVFPWMEIILGLLLFFLIILMALFLLKRKENLLNKRIEIEKLSEKGSEIYTFES